MTIKMKKVGKVKNNCFEVEIEYIHANGCIDFKTLGKQVLNTSDISELEKFINSFKEASAIISDSRDECEAVPDSFKRQFKRVLINNKYTYTIDVPDTSLYIMIIQDHTDDGEGDYTVYADMSIKKITFIDDNMNIFDISF